MNQYYASDWEVIKNMDQIPKDPDFNPTKDIDIILMDDPGGGGDGPTKGLSAIYSGTVCDSGTGAPIPGATIILTQGGNKLHSMAADNNGNFSVTLISRPDTITISATEYKQFSWPASEYQHKFELERVIKDLDPVVLPPGEKNQWLWLIAIGVGIWAISKNS